MKIAVVGSRTWSNKAAIIAFVNTLPPDTVVVTGGAKGVDRMAEDAALRCGLRVLLFTPDWRKNGKQAGILRNSAIVEAADRVVAFWDGASRGTADTLMKTINARKPLEVLYADGRFENIPENVWDELIALGIVRIEKDGS